MHILLYLLYQIYYIKFSESTFIPAYVPVPWSLTVFESILDSVRSIDWSGFEISIFELLLVVFALIRKFNLLSVVILVIVLGKGFVMVQINTDFSGPFVDTIPFIVYAIFSLIFLIYAIVRLFSADS